MSSTTKKGFTPLHLAAKYGNIKVAKLLLGKETEVDAEGKNGVTPLHVAVHYDNTALALLLLERGASPHAAAKNGYTPLHISAKKNQLDIARTLLEYGGKVNSESKAGFTPLHLAAQEGHIEMAELLVKAEAEVNNKAKNGLTPLHLCAQEDRTEVARLLVDSGAECDNETRAGYTPLHVAAHFGQINMVRYLLSQGVRVDVQNELGYTPLHQAAQQGHSQIVNLLLESNASPNQISNNGQTALSIAQKLGYISVVETLKVVTDEVVTTTTTTTVEEKYRVLAPESMQETFMSDSEDEGGYMGEECLNDRKIYLPHFEQSIVEPREENPQDHTYKYLTSEEMKGLGDDSMQIDVTNDEKEKKESMNRVAELSIEKKILELEKSRDYNLEAEILINNDQTDNIEIPTKPPVSAGVKGAHSFASVATSVGNQSTTSSMWRERFLVSFMVDARGGAMRGCRHSGVRVIIPPRKAPMPMRVTCRYLKKDKLVHPPPLNEGEALASRILELGPAKANFLGPVIIEVPHFASLRGREREIIILRSDDGEKWREHSLEATEEAVQEVLQESFDGEDAGPLEDLNTNRITRILTTDFPQYFAIITRIRQELHYIGPEGGLVNSSVVPQVQALFPQAALTKKIKVGLQAQPIPPELAAKLLGNRVAVSPIVTVEPRRRKFHKPITLTIPVPVAAGKGMINQYSGDTPTLRLLCSITGVFRKRSLKVSSTNNYKYSTSGTTRAQWEDVTGSTPLNFLNDCVSFTTTVSARFWLMDCRNVPEATKMATTLYKEAIHVPFMAKYVVFAKRHEQLEARMRVFCMTDDREEKTLEHQEHFHEVAKSRDVEVLEGKTHYLEFAGNLTPVTKSGDQLTNKFLAFRENRLPFTVRVKDPNNDPLGRISFFREARTGKGEVQPNPICNLNISLPGDISPDHSYTDKDIMAIQEKYSFLRDSGYGKLNTIQKADLRISDISNHLGKDWVKVARELDIEDQDINLIITEYPDNLGQQAMVMLRLWLNTAGHKATGNALKSALASCGRQDIIDECTISLSEVTDQDEMNIAEHELLQDGFDTFKAGLNGFGGKNSTLKRDYSMDVSYDENEIHQDRKHMSEISEERTESSDETEIKYRAEEKVFTESSFSQQSSTSQDSSLQKSSLIQDSFDEVKMTHEESFSETRKESKMEIIESMVEGKMEKMSLDEVTSKQTVKSSTEQNVQEMKIQESSVQQSLVQESMESSVKHQSSVQESMMQQSTKQSIIQESSVQESTIQESSVQESMIQESSAQESMIHESSAQESMIQESSVQESIIQESSFQESMIQESSIQESVVQESMVQESSVQESFVQETKIQKSSIQEEQTEESIASNAQKQESRIGTSTRVHESEVTELVTENSAVKEVVQESKKEEMIEEIKFNEETKNGVTTSSEEKNLTIETTDSTLGANNAFTGTKTSLDEAGVTVVNEADKEDKEDKGDKGENEKEKKGIKAAGASSSPSLHPLPCPNLTSPNVSTILNYVTIETDLKQGVEISLDPKESFGITVHDLDHTSEEKQTTDISRKIKESKLTLEKKIQKLAHEIAGTPESPLTESGLFTDTGISSLDLTGDKLRTRKLLLDLREPTTDTDMDYSELSPSSIGHDLPPFSPEQSEGIDSTHNLAAAQESNTSRSTQYGAHCDAQLSPILFLDNKATSPMGVRGTAELLRTTKDASSSPPQHTMHSASTSPPQKGDLDPSRTSTQVTTPNEPTNREIGYQSSLDFELELNCPMAEEAGLKKNITLERVQTKNSVEGRRSVEDLAKCFEDMATEGISKRPQSLHSEKGLPEDEGLNLETPGREAYREEQVVEIEVEQKELQIMDKTYKEDSLLNTEVWPSKGNLIFVLVKAQNLQKKDIFSKSDPYATISFQGNHQSTETIKNNNNPEWNHQIELNITDYQNLEIGIEIFNKKKIGKDDSLGYVTLNSQELSNLNSWVDLKGCKKGQVFVFSEFIPEETLQSLEKRDIDLLKLTTKTEKKLNDQNTNDRTNLDSETQKLEHAKLMVKAQEIEEAPKLKLCKQHEEDHMHEAQEFEGQKIKEDSQKMEVLKLEEINEVTEGILQLTVHCGKSLTNKDVFGKSDPYVIVEYDNKKHRSETVKNNLNPKFEFVVSLSVNKDSSDEIYINLFDEDIGKDDVLGFAVLTVGDLIRQNADNRVVKLMNVKSGEIHFSSSFYPKETIKESNKLEVAESFEEIKNPEEAQLLLEKIKLKETQKFRQVHNLEEEKESKQVQNLMENNKMDEALNLEKVKKINESHLPEESKKNKVQKLEEAQEESQKIEEVQKLEKKIKLEEAQKLEKSLKIDEVMKLEESKKKEDTKSIKIEEAQKLEERNKVKEVQELEESKMSEVTQCIKIEVAQKLEERNEAEKVQKLGEIKKKEDTQPVKIEVAQNLEERNEVKEVQQLAESKKREDEQDMQIELEQKLEKRNKFEEVQKLEESKKLEGTQNIKIEESKMLEDTQSIKIEEAKKLEDTQNIKIEESKKLEDTQSIKIEEAKKLEDTQHIKIEEAQNLEKRKSEEVLKLEERIKLEDEQSDEERHKLEEVQQLEENKKREDKQDMKIEVEQKLEKRNKLKEVEKLEDVQNIKIEEIKKLEDTQSIKIEESKKLEDIQSIKIEESKKLEDTQSIKIEESKKLEDVQSIKIEESKKLEDTQSIKIEESKKLEDIQSIKIEEAQNLEKRNKSEEVLKLEERIKLEDEQSDDKRYKLEEMQKLENTQKLVESITIEEDSMKKVEVGILKLIIHCGKNLANKDVFGKSDPYVVVEYDSHKYRSTTVKNNLNPKFEFAVDLIVDKDSSDEIFINLFDEDFGKDDALGFAVLNVGDLIRQNADIKVVELMHVKSGELYISSIFHEKEIDFKKDESKEAWKPQRQKADNEALMPTDITKPGDGTKLENDPKLEIVKMLTEDKLLEEAKSLDQAKKLLDDVGKPENTSMLSQSILNFHSSEKQDVSIKFSKEYQNEDSRFESFLSNKTKVIIREDMHQKTVVSQDLILRTDEQDELIETKFDDLELDRELNVIFDNNVEVISFEVEKDLCSQLSKGKIVQEISKEFEHPSPVLTKEVKNVEKDVGSYTTTEDQCSPDLSPIFLKEDFDNSNSDIELKIKEVSSKQENEKSTDHAEMWKTIKFEEHEALDSMDVLAVQKMEKEFEENLNINMKDNAKKDDNKSDVLGSVAKPVSGRCQLTIHSCTDLVNKDTLGKSDPYVVLEYGDKKYRSETERNNLNPNWDFYTEFHFDTNKSDEIFINVFDEDIIRDDAMGFIALNILELVDSNPVERKRENLLCGKGGITFSSIITQEGESGNTAKELASLGEYFFLEQQQEVKEFKEIQKDKKQEEVQRHDETPSLEEIRKLEESEDIKELKECKKTEVQRVAEVNELIKCSKLEQSNKEKLQMPKKTLTLAEAKKLEQDKKIKKGQMHDEGKEVEEANIKEEDWVFKKAQMLEENKKLEQSQEVKQGGTLQLIVHCGKNLANKDVFGKSDPYVVVEYDRHKFRSKTVKNHLNPKFEFAVDLQVDKNSSDEIYINLFDEDIGKDDALGFAVLNVEELIRQNADTKVVELLNVKSGELYISSVFHQKEIDSEKEEPKSYQEALKEPQKPKAYKEANELLEPKTVGEAQSLKEIQKPEIAEKLKDTKKLDERIMMEEFQNIEEVRQFEKSKKLKEVWELEIDQQLQEAHKLHESKEIENKLKFEENFEFDKAQNLQNTQVLLERKKQTEKEHVRNIKQDGVLQLNIHNGKNLANKDSFDKSDPYVVVEYGSKKYRSKTVKNNLNPIFEFVVSFIIDKNSSDEIYINVFDEDIGKDDALGFAVLNVGDLIRQNVDITVAELMNVKSGELYISSSFSPNETISVQELTVVNTSEETSFRKIQETDELVTIRDIVKDQAYIEAEKQKPVDIESKSSSIDNKKRDTISLHIHRVKKLLLENPVPLNIFVTVSLDSEVKKSFKSIYNETIVFDFKCHFGVDGGSGETLTIKIFADNRDEDSQCLGKCILSIDEVKDKCILETWMPLSNTKSGDIQLSVQYKTIINEPVVKTVLSRQTFISKQEAEMPVEEEKVIMQMTNLGVEDISIIEKLDANEERILLENVSKLQNNMSFKIEELVGTIRNADKTLLTTDNINYFSSKTNLDNCGNITEFTSSHSITTESYSFSQSHVDNQGNIVQARDVIFQHKFSPENETSPTFDDVIYNEYPHLFKPTLNQSLEKTEIVNKYWHTSQQPFENISSFRAHFVQSFCDENNFAEKNKTKDQISVDNSKVEDYFNANSEVVDKFVLGNQDQDIFKLSQQHFPTFGLGKFEDDLESGLGMLSPDTTTLRTLDTNEGGLQSLDFVGDLEVLEKDAPCSAESYTSQLDCFIYGSEKEIAEIYSENLIDDGEIFPESKAVSSSEYQSSLLINSVAEWMKPLISCNCLQSKNFWISGEVVREPSQSLNNPDFSSTDASPSSEMSSRLGCSPRSPLSIVKSLSPTDSVQSLPSSPRKTVRSVSVKKLTSESFSSENDISRSLEIVYVEPEFDPKETFTAQYRTHSPLNTDNSKFEKRKPSFTQLKRPTSYDLRSDSPDKGNLSESDIPSSASPDIFEISKATSAEFTPYVSDIEPVLNKKLTSPTKIIAPYTSSPPVQHVVSNETISPILEILSQTPLRSPEKKFEYVQGLKETLEESFEIIEPSSRSGVELKHEPSSEYSEESEPESPKSTSPKASSGSKSSSQQSGASRSSSAASSHGSSKEDLSNLKETEQELLDEIIVKDVPDVSTDPVLQFEDNRTSIESIQEDAEDQHSECKDLINDMVTSYTNPTLNFLSPNSFSNPNEMPSKEEQSSSTGLAAPDSKDSLEVHLYSVSDDISETASVKDETEKARNYSTPSEDESAVSIEQSALINVNEADQDIVFEEKKIVEARKETEDEDERSSGEEHFEFIQNEELKDEIQNIGEITDVGSSKYDEIHNVEEVEEEVYSEVKAKQIVESVQKEALTEAEIKSRKISEVIEAFEKIETDEKSDKSIEHGLKSAISKLEEHITQEDECVAVSAYKTTRSMSSSSEEASKLFAQESTDSNSASGLEGQNFTDLSMLEKGNNYEHSSLKQTMKKLEAHISSEDECIAVTAYRTTSSMSSTSEEAGIAPAHGSIDLIRSDAELGIVTQDSTDTSESSKQEITEDTVKIQEEVEQIGSIENDTSEAFKHSSTDSSDTEEKDEVHKGAESSSDYDTSSAKPRAKRPDSFVSDTSSDYDSMSNPGSRRPQSFLVEDDFDIITEEDICHLKSKQDDLKELSEDEDSLDKNHPDKSFDNVHDSSSESEGPDEKKQEKIIKEETLLSMDQDGISSIPRPTSSSPLPSSMTNTLDLHANQSTVSVDLAVSSVIHSNTLEEIDPLVVDGSRAPSNSSPLADGFLPSLTPSPLTRSSDFNTEEINSSQDLRNEEDKTTSSFSKSVKLSFPSQTDSPIKSTHIESSQPTQSSSFDLKSNTIQSSRFTSQSQDLQAVLEGISKSTVSTRLSELHKEEHSVFISVTEPATEDFVMVRRESSKSTDSEPSFRCRHLGSSSSEKSMEEKMRHDTSFRSSYEGSEIASPNNTDQFDAYTTQTMEEDDPMNTNEYKPIPKHKQLQKINSTDLLHRNIKETIVQQVMCEDDDSVMSESTITTLKSDNDDFTAIIESRNMELEFSVDKPIQKLSDIGSHKEEHAFKTAEEIFVEEPDWELVETQKENERILGEEETVFKRSMTPEQALEIASEIVQNVQVEAVKRYEAMKKSNSLPKPTPDSKYTPETKEKVQVYLKELEESEQYDHVAAELITHVVSKKEEQYMKMNNQISVDITDEEPRSDAMMSELRNELGRSSVTDEDLVTDLTTELLEENTIEEMKKHLESTLHSHEFQLESSFKFQTSFRTHFVDDVYGTSDENDGKTYTEKEFLCTENDDIYNFEEHKNLSSSQQADSFISEDIWEQESKSVTKQDFIKLREKKSNTESDSSGSKQSFRKSGTDHEGYSSSGETYSADRNNSSLSRPCSSDVEAIMSAVSEKSSTTGNTEYVTAHDHSSADTSFFTAASTLSSRGSVISSESSGHLGSREVSECSETLIESSLDLDSHHDGADTPNTFNQLQYALEESSFCPLESEDSTPSTEKSHGSAMQVGKSQENKILTSDDIDGCCFSQSLQDEENEKEYLIQDGKNRFGSMFSESRETLSSSVLTLSSVSEITVVGNEASYNKMISSQYSHSSVEKQSDSLSVSQLLMTESSSSSSSAAIYTTSKAESSEVPSSFEDLAKDNSTEQDQVFFMPRVRSFEGAHSVQISIPQEQSLDLGSEFDSRPNSELKDVESRPLSAQKLSRSNSQEDQKTGFSRRAFSIDETVSDGLKVFEPYCRPKSPMPLNESNRSSLDSESMQLRVGVSSSVRCPSPFNQKYQSEESIETELAFSKHFTQVLDDSEYETSEIIKTNQNENVHLTTGQLMDLTPESCNTSESLETSQGNDYYLEHDGKEFKARSPKLPFDLEDDLLVGSPPMVSRPLGVKYWPPVDNLDQELDACGPLEKRRIVRSESDDNSESRLELDNEMIEKEVEQGKRWLENQFEETPDEFGNFSYGQPLDQILEEEEDRYSYTTEDMKELQKFKESLTSTPDFDSIINKRHQVSKSGDDDLSMGSLTEFERLEREVALGSGSGSRGSLGSNDSLEVYSNGSGTGTGAGKPTHLSVKTVSKSGLGDNISVSSLNSLKSFEMIESACAEAALIEAKAKHQEEVLSEIEEGHESQVSESESCETISECGQKSDDEYEDRLFEIDSIIKQAQANVEKFETDKKQVGEILLADIIGKPESRTASISSTDSLDESVPEIQKESPFRRQSSIPTRITSAYGSRTTSVTSLQSVTSASTLTQYDPDSVQDRDFDDEELDIMGKSMHISIDSLRAKSPENTMITSTDSLDPNTPRDKMTFSTDSIENAKSSDHMTVSLDSLDGAGKEDRSKDYTFETQGATSMLFTSTDSIESCSTNTRATASMLSSMTSQGSETLVADDEFEHDDEDSRSARRFLLNQGNLLFEDSDDSTTCSHSSPQLPARLFNKDSSECRLEKISTKPEHANVVSSEEVVETEEIDEKGNLIIKKVIQKRFYSEQTRRTENKREGYVSDVSSEKKDDSCEETMEEIDEFGNRKVYVVKRSIEFNKSKTMDAVDERELFDLSSAEPLSKNPKSKN
ncbi:uncharacterized protein LOC111696970 isoform X12 [Eurytemora carolleeae]|uniref:uncharacterized protein LOC111696970 isoform X12 n=1 Tax=Eurytemora carolleeae TaxID=1294199 RepID=UPI000C7573AF|nr:uncharacterized protein LOC111696970 isoform X12 [Eurytemora carolleeae]|eukprot:XP_023322574.1 uncharacterized protein LOC111696970 isoform X12 [Eurytemora affinis]